MTIFSVGVGGYDVDELHAVASDPPCSHTYTLSDFSVIESILFEIQRDTCRGGCKLVENSTGKRNCSSSKRKEKNTK